MHPRPLALSLLALTLAAPSLRAEEGMWTFDNPPTKQIQEKYGWAPDQAWLDHVRLSSLRFPGGSGSFVSRDGLVLTNHHVGRGWIQRVSSKDADYVQNGFAAATREQEIKVPGLEVMTLMTMDNITERLAKALKEGLPEKEALKAREVEIEKIKGEMQQKSGLTCEHVSLYQGGEHWIYSYKKHTDVRLVFARSSRSPSLAAIPTTSRSRARTWISPSSGSTRTASPTSPRTSCTGPRRGSRPGT